MPQCELMTICMIINRENNTVLVQNRTKASWQGIAFPGGHVEQNESFASCIVREVREETGLTISDVHLTGLVHWEHEKTHVRSIIACYKAYSWTGELHSVCEEGTHEWISLDKLQRRELAPYLREQLPAFEDDSVLEVFYTYNDETVHSPTTYRVDSAF